MRLIMVYPSSIEKSYTDIAASVISWQTLIGYTVASDLGLYCLQKSSSNTLSFLK